MRFHLVLYFMIFSLISFSQQSRKNSKPFYLGLNYGQAAQDRFPFNNPNYLYTTEFFKLQINYQLAHKRFIYELLVEPSLYFSEHQMLNKYFIKPDSPFDTEAQLQEFLRLKSFQEYALHIGLVLRYEITESFSTYAVGSVGPMVSNLGTERLRKGFAFSNVLGFGLSYRQNRLLFDVRLCFKHNSNANLYLPNNGHNNVGIESGMSYQLK